MTPPRTHRDLLNATAHRAHPLPPGPWVMYQEWRDLLFMHWPTRIDELRDKVPPQLSLDTFDGHPWLAVVPFDIPRLRIRGLPPIPGMVRFLELNVRTYVRVNGKAGVYFFSLDASSRLAVEGARLTYGLPYFRARMALERRRGQIVYACERRDSRGRPSQFRGTYGPIAEVEPAEPASLAHWLTERYYLYTVRGGQVYEAAIHHLPWPLQRAGAAVEVNTMAAEHGISLGTGAPLLHYSGVQAVLVWPPTLV